jgi:hypothetical protein
MKMDREENLSTAKNLLRVIEKLQRAGRRGDIVGVIANELDAKDRKAAQQSVQQTAVCGCADHTWNVNQIGLQEVMVKNFFEIAEMTKLGKQVYQIVEDGNPQGKYVIISVEEWEAYEAAQQCVGRTVEHAEDCAVNVGMLGECDCGAE